MAIGEGQGGDYPPSIPAMTPEEAMQKLFQKAEPVEHQWREIKRGEFMMALHERMGQAIELFLKAQNAANAAQNDMNEARGIYAKAEAMQASVKNAEDNDFKVNFFVDQFGNFSIRWVSKDDIGFRKGGEG